MKIIGIDPGLADTGIGIVKGSGLTVEGFSFGSIQTSNSTSLPGRLDIIYSKLLNLLEDEKPDMMIIEDVFSLQKYPQSGITLGQVSGVVLLAGFHSGIRSARVPVREAKRILTGNGNASKMQLEKSVRRVLHLTEPIRPYHASDALGLALIGLYRNSGGGDARIDALH